MAFKQSPQNHCEAPSFPSLYWPVEPGSQPPQYLYCIRDIWRFTLFWNLILYAAFHLASSIYAFVMHHRNRHALGFPVLFALIGGIEAAIAGSIIGSLLGAIYHAGYFQMSTWTPLVWGVINVLILVLSSFSLQGGL